MILYLTINIINQMKKYILTAAVSLVATGVYAQSVDEAMVAESYTETITEMKIDFKSNWFISAGVGGQVFFGDHDRQASFGDRLSPALDIAVGKWFSPSIGVRLMYSGLSGKGATQTWGDPNGGIYNTPDSDLQFKTPMTDGNRSQVDAALAEKPVSDQHAALLLDLLQKVLGDEGVRAQGHVAAVAFDAADAQQHHVASLEIGLHLGPGHVGKSHNNQSPPSR